MPGLIRASTRKAPALEVDCRVKPGNDKGIKRWQRGIQAWRFAPPQV
jgi:hypothetical protein